MTTPSPTLADLLRETGELLEERALGQDHLGPREMIELAGFLIRWASHAERLQIMAGAAAATIAAAELAAIENGRLQ